jgi:hypothetical protein
MPSMLKIKVLNFPQVHECHDNMYFHRPSLTHIADIFQSIKAGIRLAHDCKMLLLS